MECFSTVYLGLQILVVFLDAPFFTAMVLLFWFFFFLGGGGVTFAGTITEPVTTVQQESDLKKQTFVRVT